MPTVNLSPVFNGWQGFTTSGLILSAGLLYAYAAGTTTPQATYTDATGTVANSNPIVLGPDGRPPFEIWITQGQSYKFELKDALFNSIKTYDDISSESWRLRADLAAASGSSLVGFIQAGTGAVADTVQAELRTRFLPQQFQILADGSDETAKVRNWLSAAAAANLVADGLGVTIGISGSLDVSAYTGLQWERPSLTQLAPTGSSTLKTVYALNNSGLRISNLTINRNGGETIGSVGASAGLWVEDCDGVIIERCVVYGGGPGNGIVVESCVDPIVRFNTVRDMNHNVGATDDQIQGIWIDNCTRPQVYGNLVQRLTGTGTVRFTRGFAISGCDGSDVYGNKTDHVDQGLDYTGSIGNINFDHHDNEAADCGTYGHKFSNSFRNGKVHGNTALRCGYFGIEISGPSDRETPAANLTLSASTVGTGRTVVASAGVFTSAHLGRRMTDAATGTAVITTVTDSQHVTITIQTAMSSTSLASGGWFISLPLPRDLDVFDNQIIDSGSNGIWVANNPGGIRIETSSYDVDYPRCVRVRNNKVVDTQLTPTTVRGLVNQVSPIERPTLDYDKPDGNTETGNEVINVTSAANRFVGWHYPVWTLAGTGTTSATTSTFTNVQFASTDIYDPSAVHNPASNADISNIKESGTYLVCGQIAFAASAVGQRKATIALNGVTLTGPVAQQPAHATQLTIVPFSFPWFFNSGDSVAAQGWQNSGGALNIDQANSYITVSKVMN